MPPFAHATHPVIVVVVTPPPGFFGSGMSGDHGLGGEQQAGDARPVLEGAAGDLHRVHHAGLRRSVYSSESAL